MNKLKIIIIDDELPAREIIKNYLQKNPNIEIIAECENGFEAVKCINELRPDLIFLDIQMPKLSGFEVVELIEHKPKIIFTTAFDQYAIKAFEANASDYLLKPFLQSRLETAINKINVSNDSDKKQNIYDNFLEIKDDYLTRIAVKSNNKISIIPCKDILYIQAEDDYVMIYTEKEKHLKEKTMKSLEKSLNPSDFLRVHRSFIANISKITKIEHFSKDNFLAQMTNGEKIKVSYEGFRQIKETLDL